jgi:hypothetical protein
MRLGASARPVSKRVGKVRHLPWAFCALPAAAANRHGVLSNTSLKLGENGGTGPLIVTRVDDRPRRRQGTRVASSRPNVLPRAPGRVRSVAQDSEAPRSLCDWVTWCDERGRTDGHASPDSDRARPAGAQSGPMQDTWDRPHVGAARSPDRPHSARLFTTNGTFSVQA